MFLKNPDWDAELTVKPCTVAELSAHERSIINHHRGEWLRDLWSCVIDGEYLDVRMIGDRVALFDDDAEVEDDHGTYLPNGVYDFEFIGGYDDDWHDAFEPYARRTGTNNRDAVSVRIQAVVVSGVAKFAIQPQSTRQDGES